MPSIIQNLQKRSSSLPLSRDQQQNQQQGIRRRLSSLSVNLQPIASPSTYPWPFQTSTSMGEFAGIHSLRKWWDWGWSWILARMPIFAHHLEVNGQEAKILGSHSNGSWRHVLFKVRSELRKIVRSDDKVGLPQTCRYNSFSYSKNFQV